MTREERIKRGFVGKITIIDPETNKPIEVDLDDEDTSILTAEEFKRRNSGIKIFCECDFDNPNDWEEYKSERGEK